MEKLISAEKAIDMIRHMMDIDGFRDGRAVDRNAVIAILDGIPPTALLHGTVNIDDIDESEVRRMLERINEQPIEIIPTR